MTVRVDEPIWPWRGRRWAHLVSDSDLDELHDLAHRIGMPYVAFQGDHYDVHEDLRLAAIDLGAVPTPARELVRALRGAGLRHKGAVEPWTWEATSSVRHGEVESAIGRLRIDDSDLHDVCVAALMEIGGDGSVRAGFRAHEQIVVATRADRAVRELDLGVMRLSDQILLHRAFGERGAFVEVVVRR